MDPIWEVFMNYIMSVDKYDMFNKYFLFCLVFFSSVVYLTFVPAMYYYIFAVEKEKNNK